MIDSLVEQSTLSSTMKTFLWQYVNGKRGALVGKVYKIKGSGLYTGGDVKVADRAGGKIKLFPPPADMKPYERDDILRVQAYLKELTS